MNSQAKPGSELVLSTLKDFQRRTAEWVFERMFDEKDPSLRFLVADEVGLGKTHVAKGVIAQVLDHLSSVGDERHDIVYICSNAAIARQNLRKLVPEGVKPLEAVERLTMLPLATMNQGGEGIARINLLAITPGTSLAVGRQTGMFRERVLAFTFLRELWGDSSMATARARWIYWLGVTEGDLNLREIAADYRPRIVGHTKEFAHQVALIDAERQKAGKGSLRKLHQKLCDELRYKREFPKSLKAERSELIGEVRRAMATVGIKMLNPDLVILDEFQRFKDLLVDGSGDWAARLARQLFDSVDPESGRPARTLLLSATPYRLYARSDESDDHFGEFMKTCSFLLGDQAKVEDLRARFQDLRVGLTDARGVIGIGGTCRAIEGILQNVMARTERLGVTPDRDGMLKEIVDPAPVLPIDLEAYARFGDLAEVIGDSEPIEYWKSSPYLFNFMETYQLKRRFEAAIIENRLPMAERLEPGPGFLDWSDVSNYREIEPQNGRLRWLLSDLDAHRAYELAWLPPSLRYYDTGSVYETSAATSFTKRLVFSGWAVVPKAVASLVTVEAERRIFEGIRDHRYEDEASRRGRGRLDFRAPNGVPATMNHFALTWPSPTLAEAGNPRPTSRETIEVGQLKRKVRRRVKSLLADLKFKGSDGKRTDLRWYWAAPLLLDQAHHAAAIDGWFGREQSESAWNEGEESAAFAAHAEEAWRLLCGELTPLGRQPDDLVEVLADMAIGGPAVCALRALSSITGLALDDGDLLRATAMSAAALRRFFNEAEINALILRSAREQRLADDVERERYWLLVVRHAIDGNFQALLDEHFHILRDWLGFVNLSTPDEQRVAAHGISKQLSEGLGLNAASFKVDFPRGGESHSDDQEPRSLRSKFAVGFGQKVSDEKGVVRAESVSSAFNSPFWPFDLVSPSIGQEGLDFHLWSHAVVHWNLPTNPVDLEQREGRVHRFKGHAVRKNLASSIDGSMTLELHSDVWQEIFAWAEANRGADENDLVPYWVYLKGDARIERLVPLPPFSRDAALLKYLHRSLATYRLAFGQPRQEDLVEFLSQHHEGDNLERLLEEVRIDLSPPKI